MVLYIYKLIYTYVEFESITSFLSYRTIQAYFMRSLEEILKLPISYMQEMSKHAVHNN